MDRTGTKIYTLAEVAEHLRLTNRAVAKIAKRHGLCMVAGRNVLFTAEDIEKIKDVMRWPSTTPAKALRYVRSGKLAQGDPDLMALKRMVLERSKRPSHKRMLEELTRKAEK